MKLINFSSLLIFTSSSLAQTFEKFTDDNGITFWQGTWSTGVGDGDSQLGMALPDASQDTLINEYIGRLVVSRPESGTWLGIGHNSGMTGNLLLLSWVNEDDNSVMTSFRYASGYTEPAIYDGNATLGVISSSVNDTHYELTYRCQDCWAWDHDSVPGSQLPKTTTKAAQIMGWAQATDAPTNPNEKDSGIRQHAAVGAFAVTVESARNTAYTDWTSLASASATATATGVDASPTGNVTTPTSPTNSTVTSAACAENRVISNTTFDYIVVGAGAGGIPLADKLSESGASVLLIEKGPPSSGRWGGTMKPEWLVGTNLTRFDINALNNEVWRDSEGIACSDVATMAGCVLGGGTAVNAGLWWKPNPEDFDYNFPEGWKAADMEGAIDRTFSRIPFTQTPSMDGRIYQGQGYDIIGGALAASGWKNVTAGDEPAEKNHTFSRPNHMYSNGERGGPLATYLVTANERENFQLMVNTTVHRVLRDGARITGVETGATLDGGQCGTINVTPGTGKVILSAGAFGTPKILFRSGIGPKDQLDIVSKAEGDAMVTSSQWIDLPVGRNLDDHANTDIVITHPNVTSYDFYGAYEKPIVSDVDRFLANRTGMLTQSAPNLATVFWQEITGADGITRQLQWTARGEGSHGIVDEKAMTISQYLGRGAIGRGRTTITPALNMVISEVPYLKDENDVAAVAAGIESLRQALATDPSIQIVHPPANQTTEKFLADYPLTPGARSANHWIGTCKMGLDSGLDNGTAVVDTNTKVYGTDNLFVVDAAVFPGMVTTNPSALIVSVAEHASEKIMALDASAGAENASEKIVALDTSVGAERTIRLTAKRFEGARKK
ncbi:related to cellobiose dehydrogenase [Ramularia collo-cygni]|uniref:Related to cellobiose dehydrogenase n=1 Tax=Ramularia collo-cygni TaxID=112498 RepID=A0A2D3UUR4_9PEZI|nr:related to cellobiose dehydrogenase [Ramularia collo-cygni]CZT21382.1 related to cellobiose dehydrogenase [Ramularia collo-cygni]